jgi:hypothetical protein
MLPPSATWLPFGGLLIGSPPSLLRSPEVLTEAELAGYDGEK